MPEKIKLLILDVDGVLTDGGIYFTSNGDEIKRFNVQDGSGIRLMFHAEIPVAIITGRTSELVARRCADLGIEDVYQGALDKRIPYEELREKHSLSNDEICCIGDDLHDLPMLTRCGFPVAVANARDEVKEVARYVTQASGGDGAVREAIEKILRAQNLWDNLLNEYLKPS